MWVGLRGAGAEPYHRGDDRGGVAARLLPARAVARPERPRRRVIRHGAGVRARGVEQHILLDAPPSRLRPRAGAQASGRGISAPGRAARTSKSDFRSMFAQWADEGGVKGSVWNAALAHKIKNQVEAAYQ